MFGLLHNHTLVFQDSRPAGGGVTSFSFVPDKPFDWRAGQHGVLSVGAMARKAFSVASAPEEGRVVIGTSVQSGSSFKQRLAALRPGDKVGFRGPVNQTFNLDGAAPRVVLLAQGVGITPLRAMLAHAAMVGLNLESSLIHVAHDGHAYRDETQQWATRAEYPQRAADFQAAARVAAKTTPDATFFIAGAPQFVSSTASLLHESGVAGPAVRTDKYLGYKPTPGVAPAGVAAPVR